MSRMMSLLLIVALSTWPVSTSDVLWTWDETLDDVIKVPNPPSRTQVKRAVNVGHCASLCTSNVSCSSFFFLSKTGECRLNEFVFATRADGQSSPGARYFKAFSASCPSGDGYVWLRGPGICIKVYLDSPNFKSAYKSCVDAGSRLAVLDKGDKLTVTAAYMADLASKITRAFIGGMRDGAANGSRASWDKYRDPLYWLNGVQVAISGPDAYWDLPALNPSNDRNEEGCMEIFSGLWNDMVCNSGHPYICEKI
ncbi:uncharacterized protein LOC112575868 [Pomacea canaliculata]|uniref:uncharacterized protein LOC112575868 n=1 Tax=Pomacea canaliculata TaxID=400727 RepID=UPI000D72AC73|nr:uncharacterized protein LOC112575868 [Pomacea canaliculata]